MSVLRGSQKIFGSNPDAKSLAQEFREHAALERSDAIEAIAKAIRKGDVRAAVWFLVNTGENVAVGPEGAVTGVIAPERVQPSMAARPLRVVGGTSPDIPKTAGGGVTPK